MAICSFTVGAERAGGGASSAGSSAGSFLGSFTTWLFFKVLWFCLANVSAAVVISGLPGLPGLLLPLPLLLLWELVSDSCRCRVTDVADAATGTTTTRLSSLGLLLSASDGGRSITRSGVCFCLKFSCDVTWVDGEDDVTDARFSHRSRLRTNDPLVVIPWLLGSDHPPTETLTLDSGRMTTRSRLVILRVSHACRRNWVSFSTWTSRFWRLWLLLCSSRAAAPCSVSSEASGAKLVKLSARLFSSLSAKLSQSSRSVVSVTSVSARLMEEASVVHFPPSVLRFCFNKAIGLFRGFLLLFLSPFFFFSLCLFSLSHSHSRSRSFSLSASFFFNYTRSNFLFHL